MTLFVITACVVALVASAALIVPILRASTKDAANNGANKVLRLSTVAGAGAAPLFAALIYLAIGSPQALDPAVRNAPAANDPAAIAAMAPEEREAMVEGMVEGLAARLADNPEDLQGWRMLGRSYAVLGRYDESADAWREALVLSEGAADDWRGLAISLTEISLRDPEAGVGPAIKEALEEVLLQEPDDAMSLFFLGNAALAAGDTGRGKELLARLRSQIPDEAPLAAEVDRLLAEAPEQLGHSPGRGTKRDDACCRR